ncbi:ATP-binding cassette domain-containing protein [Phytobacter massiliensis]|uniref:ATP-binding cassette domain-containing protein n=1 Tax=Phytobacter massiliensis TaxID=1485952 RepID=UPI0002DE5BD8|nr:ATP-binding cassette domain-containing protein [Phytobacter massiliensis]
MNTPLLQVQHVSKTFHRRGQAVQAVDNVSFSINAGETWALVGESGSGKSTTGRLILGLTAASAGEVILTACRSLAGAPGSGGAYAGRCR